MNNFPWPYMPNQMPPFVNKANNIEEEIVILKHEIKILKEKVMALEKKEKDDYLKKEDGLYMI